MKRHIKAAGINVSKWEGSVANSYQVWYGKHRAKKELMIQHEGTSSETIQETQNVLVRNVVAVFIVKGAYCYIGDSNISPSHHQ